jgi:UV DNA damage repair endonuclease
VYVRQIKHVVHHLRVLEGLGLDPIDNSQVELFIGKKQQRDGQDRHGKQAAELS